MKKVTKDDVKKFWSEHKNKCGDDKFTHFILLGPNPER